MHITHFCLRKDTRASVLAVCLCFTRQYFVKYKHLIQITAVSMSDNTLFECLSSEEITSCSFSMNSHEMVYGRNRTELSDARDLGHTEPYIKKISASSRTISKKHHHSPTSPASLNSKYKLRAIHRR